VSFLMADFVLNPISDVVQPFLPHVYRSINKYSGLSIEDGIYRSVVAICIYVYNIYVHIQSI